MTIWRDKKSSKQNTELPRFRFRSSIIPTSVSEPYDINRLVVSFSTRITWEALAACWQQLTST